MTADAPHNESPSIHQTTPDKAEAVVSAEALFGGKKELWIEHAGVRYKLRITRRNRLILQK